MIRIRILSESSGGAVIQQNKDFLEKSKNNLSILDHLGLSPEETERASEEIVNKLPLLKIKKIKTFLGKGAYANVFLLDNDHVLKLFVSGADLENDLQWFKYCMNKTHRGEAKITTLPVYDMGEVKLFGESKTLYFVEMARFKPLKDFLKNTGRGQLSEEVSMWIRLLKNVLNKAGNDIPQSSPEQSWTTLKKYLKSINNPKRAILEKAVLTPVEKTSLINTMKNLVADGFYLADIHIDNIGYLEQSRPENPVFVIFDK